jgi:hypothetical protein
MLCSGWTTRWQSSAKETTSILKSKGWYEATVTLPTYQSTYKSYTWVLMTDPLFADPLHWWHDNHDVDRVQQRNPALPRSTPFLSGYLTCMQCIKPRYTTRPANHLGRRGQAPCIHHWCCATRPALQHRAQLTATLTMTDTHADVDIISC